MIFNLLESFLNYLVSFYIVRLGKFLAVFSLFLLNQGVFADTSVVDMRIGRHQDFVRIVFSASEAHIRNTVVRQAGNSAIVNFPPNLKLFSNGAPVRDRRFSAEDIIIEIIDDACVLNFKRHGRIDVFRLSSPPRLVIDIYPERDSGVEKASDISPYLFVLDPGHGGYDYGIRGKGFVEKEFVFSFVKELSNMFEKRGKKVLITRKGDYFLPLKERIKIAFQKNPDMFISIHVSSKNEFRIYSAPQSKSDVDALNYMLEEIKKEFKINTFHDRLPLAMLFDLNAAFLLELPNPDEFTYDKKSKEKMVNILVKGLSELVVKLKERDGHR